MSTESIGDLVQRARGDLSARAEPGSERERLVRLAAEFESMLMLQMLKEMRKAGSWDDEGGRDGYGAQTLLETIDVELAGHLSRAQGLGLGRQMLEALERMNPQAVADRGAPVLLGSLSTRLPAPAAVLGSAGTGPSSEPDAPFAVPEGAVTSGFGWRQDPFHGSPRFHRGIDIRAAYGQEVPTSAPGRVVSAGLEGGYGQTVVIEHGGGVRTRYAHLSTTLVAAGDEVAAGQAVGRAGHSGRATGTHLHFEIMAANGTRMNPEDFAGFKPEGPGADFMHGQ